MSQSVVDICNSALSMVGASSIMSLGDPSREARVCNLQYDSNRRAELRKHYWNFAKARATLAPDADAPAFEFKYAFTLPSDCVRLILPRDAGLDWTLEGRKILTNSGPQLNIRYIADISDATLYDPTFYNVLTIAVAIDICEPLTQSNQKKQLLMQEYRDAIAEARQANAFESLSQEAPDDSFWLVRY
jgi:hypothetical protein